MATLTRGKTFGATEEVTNTKLHQLIDSGTVTDIANADIASGAAIDLSKIDFATANADVTWARSTTNALLTVDQNGNGISIDIDSEATTVDILNIQPTVLTTGIVIDIADADALTTGKILNAVSNSAETDTRDLIAVHNNNAAAVGATCIGVTQDSIGPGVDIDSTGNGPHIRLIGDPTVASPTDGDLWYDGSALNFRDGASTIDLLSTGANFKIGQLTRNTADASGNQAVTGVGFTPTIVMLWMSQEATVGETSFGLDDGTLHFVHIDSGAAILGKWNVNATQSILDDEASGNIYSATIGSLDADGFTLAWVKTNSPTGTITVTYLALG